MNSTTTTLITEESYVPAHVQRWVSDMLDKTSVPHSSKDEALESYNAIESEVIEGGRRSSRIEACESSSDDESHEPMFGRHLFQNKKAHRVACLLASARLISSFINDPNA